MRAAVLAALLAVSACNDRTRRLPPVVFEPSPDAGVDAAPDLGPPVDPDPFCEGALDGASCALPNALGVCARQRCVLVTCEEGWADCLGLLGCETLLSEPPNCGGCGVDCAEGQQCRRGPAGFVCAGGIVCPQDAWDLDSDAANGCEWSGAWEAPYALAPPDLEIEAVGWGETGPLVAGGVDDARISVALGATPQATIWPEPRAGARAVDVRLDDAHERVVWTDGVSLRRLDDQATSFAAAPCVEAAVPRQFVAATDALVATQFEIFRVDTFCAEGLCLAPFFGLADYHTATFAGRGAAEVVMCDGCALALDAECWGLEQCRHPSYDATACAGCDPGACPTLEIVALVDAGAQTAVVTGRGVLVVDAAGALVASAEAPFDPLVAGGPRFVGATAAPGALTLFHSTGFARSLGAELTALYPDLGLGFDPAAARLAGLDDVFVAVHDDSVRVVRPGPASGRTVFLDLSTAPGIQGLAPVAPVVTPDGVRVLYVAAGQLYPRMLTR